MWATIISFIPGFFIWFQALMLVFIPSALLFVYNKFKNRLHAVKYKMAEQALHKEDNNGGPVILGQLDQDVELLNEKVGHNSDVHFRSFHLQPLNCRASLIYVEGMQRSDFINVHILKPLMMERALYLNRSTIDIAAYVKEHLLPVIHVVEVENINTLSQMILFGYTVLLIEGMNTALMVGIPDPPGRSVQEPVSEALLRGSRIGFTENLSENTAMLRRHGMNDKLVIHAELIGNESKKTVVFTYMKDIANDELVTEIKKRIKQLDYDYFAESGYVEQLMQENNFTPFQQFHNTERPDKVIAALLEGRVAILLEGSPFALIAPVSLMSFLQSPEDYYERWISGSFTRLIRIFAAFLALFAPALYISFISFNPGLIPTQLALTIIETRQGVPFPSILEVLILEISIEILRESGIRLPKPIGPAMGIVGGLVVGEAAVQAGIVSSFLVIVVALTAISSFSIPDYSSGITIRLLRFVAMFFAAILGLYGTILFFLLISIHIIHLRSFGLPYLAPLAPMHTEDNKDVFIRSPLAFMTHRPHSLKTKKRKKI